MRVFQNGGLYPSYHAHLSEVTAGASTFEERLVAFLNDRYCACHILKPVLDRDPQAFFTNADDEESQNMWAREHGLPAGTAADSILLSQIEEHRTDVFYNLDPIRFPTAFVKRLPGSVRKSFAWRAAPSPKSDLSGYNAIVCNFPAILASYRRSGWSAEYFSPAHDPAMDEYAINSDRPIDVLFVGAYSRHHLRRAEVLEAVARPQSNNNVRVHLDSSWLSALADSPMGWFPPLRKYRRPRIIRRIAHPPIFGRDLYRALSVSKIVLNAAVDMAGKERGNMRCFEAMGCGAALVSDDGVYPSEMGAHDTMKLYATAGGAIQAITALLEDPEERVRMSRRGYESVRISYSKERQWARFCELAG